MSLAQALSTSKSSLRNAPQRIQSKGAIRWPGRNFSEDILMRTLDAARSEIPIERNQLTPCGSFLADLLQHSNKARAVLNLQTRVRNAVETGFQIASGQALHIFSCSLVL